MEAGVPPCIVLGGASARAQLPAVVERRDAYGRVLNGLLQAVGATNEALFRARPEFVFAKATALAVASAAKRSASGPASAAAAAAGADKKPVKKKPRKTAAAAAAAAATTTVTSSSEPVQLYCVCNSPWDESSGLMVGCDGPCNNWYHLECLGGLGKDSETADASVDEAKEFFCPACESTARKPLPETSRVYGQRLLNLADAMDSLAANPSEAGLQPAEKSLRVRWTLLRKVRQDTTAKCAQCDVAHHPLLPCVGGATVAASVVDAPAVAMEVDGPQSLVVHGRYLGLRGRVDKKLEGDVAVFRPDGCSDTVPLAASNLVALPKPVLDSAADGTVDWLGVSRASHDGGDQAAGPFLAHLALDQALVPLGAFASAFAAARCHDVAALLQYGTAAELNFDETVPGKDEADKGGRCDADSSPEVVVEWALFALGHAREEKDSPHTRRQIRRLEWLLAAFEDAVAVVASRLETSLSVLDVSDSADLDDFMRDRLRKRA